MNTDRKPERKGEEEKYKRKKIKINTAINGNKISYIKKSEKHIESKRERESACVCVCVCVRV